MIAVISKGSDSLVELH